MPEPHDAPARRMKGQTRKGGAGVSRRLSASLRKDQNKHKPLTASKIGFRSEGCRGGASEERGCVCGRGRGTNVRVSVDSVRHLRERITGALTRVRRRMRHETCVCIVVSLANLRGVGCLDQGKRSTPTSSGTPSRKPRRTPL
eukprot:scaffold3676_cov152-Pinguiococcus_pyrenoidosus.AAC.4